MKNFCIFADTVDYIEKNLCNPISQEDIAAACFCSLSKLQKVWHCCTHTGIKEYIAKRRLTCSAYDIVNTDLTITEIALKYQYNSPEVFLRAFRRLWGVAPSEFKSNWRSTGIFPRIIPDEKMFIGGIYMGRRVDITELYREIQETDHDSYVLCFDAVHFSSINENYGRKAGDMALTEIFHRIDSAAGENMLAFRIGGDEFAMITGLSDTDRVEKIARNVIDLNGRSIKFDGNDIPIHLRVGALKIGRNDHNIPYSELFNSMQKAILETKDVGKVIYFIDK
ncbi:MAG: diguanylate cyclase [Firmicutes bacterium]|nr:diguanylate cyclase [[Eubacterium] siraeum]MCM1488687.1 diguanylate cyclase [Bacillota bacterium]